MKTRFHKPDILPLTSIHPPTLCKASSCSSSDIKTEPLKDFNGSDTTCRSRKTRDFTQRFSRTRKVRSNRKNEKKFFITNLSVAT
ncbi:hypothetical protein HanRHA438_Chr13g0605691 [Helianthus annuus]|nr:hypothetical protein HanIR_Chr13g0647351 [Helianthus annuus]KAJ0858837.1 hypothetical protein HanRHA438_Chr13g0605691 [Helianthus annuus]